MDKGKNSQENSKRQTFFNTEFLTNILKKTVVSFKESAGTNPGDNYSCNLIALEIQIADQNEPLHLLYKTFPNHPARQKIFKELNFFLKEYQVYNLWLPELQKFQKDIGNDEILVPAMPELVAASAVDYNSDPKTWEDLDLMLNNFLLMVDVRKTYGFKMGNKLRSLDYHQVKVVLMELAKYHAIGHAYKVYKNLKSLNPKFPCIKETYFRDHSQRPSAEAMYKVIMNLVMDICKDFLHENPDILVAFRKFLDPKVPIDYLYMFLDPLGVDEDSVESLLRIPPNQKFGECVKDQWTVACHGDCWTNNILFKYDVNGNANEAVLVDLQAPREACITTDLAYFIYTSTDTNFRENYLDEMLQWYHQHFFSFCRILKVDTFPGFTLENFQGKFHRSKNFGFVYACMVYPIILQKPETTVNLDNTELEGNNGVKADDTDEYLASMFLKSGRDKEDEELLRKRLTELLIEMYEEGVI